MKHNKRLLLGFFIFCCVATTVFRGVVSVPASASNTGLLAAAGQTLSGLMPPSWSSLFFGASRGGAPPITVIGVTPSSGTEGGGTSVTITGTGFDGATYVLVTFGDAAPVIGFVTDDSDYGYGGGNGTEVLVSTPPHRPGLVDVTVQNTIGGASDTAFSAYTYLNDIIGPSGGLISAVKDFGVIASIDPVTGAWTGVFHWVYLPGENIEGFTGLTSQPGTNTLYGLAKVSGSSSRWLITLDPMTGAAALVGNTGLKLSNIAFSQFGKLYAVSGDGASPPETLYTLSLADGSPTLLTALGNGDFGEAVGYNPDDGLLYHMSGFGVQILESIDPCTLAVTNISLSGAPFGEATALVYDESSNDFIMADFDSTLHRVSTAGVVSTLLNPEIGTIKGLAFVPTFSSLPTAVVRVDFAHAGSETGSASTPWNTLAEALCAVKDGGTIRIDGTSSDVSTSETFTGGSAIAQDVTIQANPAGTVSIGSGSRRSDSDEPESGFVSRGKKKD